MKDFPGSPIEKNQPEIKTVRDRFIFFFFMTLLNLKIMNVKAFLHEVCTEACVASILGVIWDLTGLKL